MAANDQAGDADAFAELFKDERQSIKGKGIVVTGGTTGLGRAICILLVSRGARVLTFGRHEKELNDAIRDIKRVGGGEIFGAVADTTKLEDVSRVFAEADKRLGSIEAMINNAAIGGGTILKTEPEAWREVLATNLFGYMACAREAADRMTKAGRGTIINVGSMSAEARGAGSDIYVATKSGIRGFSVSLGKSLNKEGVRVTLIEPGLVGSDMTAEKTPPEKQPERIEKMEMLRAEEIAYSVLYVLEQPDRCHLDMIQIRPTKQEI